MQKTKLVNKNQFENIEGMRREENGDGREDWRKEGWRERRRDAGKKKEEVKREDVGERGLKGRRGRIPQRLNFWPGKIHILEPVKERKGRLGL